MSTVTLRHWSEYIAARLAICQLQELPVGAGLRLAEGTGAFAYHVLKGRSRTGRENIARAFPEYSPAEVEKLLKDVYRNLFRTGAEVFYLRKLVRPSTWRRFVEIVNVESAIEVFIAGRGCILVTGHLGNWEFLGHVLPFIGIHAKALARPLDNPLLDRYILGVRESGLQRILDKKGSGTQVERTLAEGGFVSILVDQDAGNRGAFVPFFNRPASTWRSTAVLAMKTGAPILPGCCVRTGKGLAFRAIVGRPIYADPTADATAETLRITADFTKQIENWVREYPQQYLWLHRRWKSVPGPRSIIAQ